MKGVSCPNVAILLNLPAQVEDVFGIANMFRAKSKIALHSASFLLP
jgi:hypothetical protein